MVISSFGTKFLSTENYSWKVTQFPGFRLKLNLLFKLSNPNSNFALTLGYLNPALNNLALKACSQIPPPPYPSLPERFAFGGGVLMSTCLSYESGAMYHIY